MTPFLASTLSTVELLSALLAVAAQVGLALLLVSALVARAGVHGARRLLAAIRAAVGPQAIAIGWLAAALAVGGSLWFSEAQHFLPCKLCWYQRTMMYPLAIVLGGAALTRDLRAWRYALPLALVGGAISIYHYQLEWFPHQGGSCDPTNPCTIIWFRELGYLTLPALALTAFAVVAAMSLLARSYERNLIAADNEGHDHG